MAIYRLKLSIPTFITSEDTFGKLYKEEGRESTD